jgi:hypothetical protein
MAPVNQYFTNNENTLIDRCVAYNIMNESINEAAEQNTVSYAIMHNKYSKAQLSICFNSVITCNCCQRHQTNNSLNIESLQVLNDIPRDAPNQPESLSCHCKCRHFARLFRRAYHYCPETNTFV